MPSSNTSQNSFQKKAERMKVFRTSQRNKLQRTTKLQIQVQEEERKRLLMADRLAYLVADQDTRKEPLRQRINMLEAENFHQKEVFLEQWLFYKDLWEGRVLASVEWSGWWLGFLFLLGLFLGVLLHWWFAGLGW
jgi:hypothetical protein